MMLPEGWVETGLGDVCELLNGRAYKRTELLTEGKYPVLRVGNFFTSDKWYYSDLELEPEKYCDTGDLLYAWSASFGPRVWTGGKVIYHYHIWRTRLAKGALDKQFLFHWFEWDKENIKAAHGTGTTMIHVTKGDMENRTICLPPPAEQRRIVAKLDALTARLARARAELDRVPVLAKRLREEVLAQAASGALVGLSDIRGRPCEEWIASTFYGPRFSKDDYVPDGIPTARTTDFNADGTMRPDEAPRVTCSDKDYDRWGCQEGDLLVTRTGSIGKCAIYDAKYGPVLPSAYLIRVRFSGGILPRFVWMMFASPSGQKHLGVNSRAVTQPNINASAIRSLPIPDLGIEQQALTVELVDQAFARADRLEAEAARARKMIDRLESAILAKAFRGELVPQDPNDEPASVLLERVRAERAAKPKPKRGRRAKADADA